MEDVLKVRATVELEMPEGSTNQDAKSWLAGVIDSVRPKCKACKGLRYLNKNMFSETTCPGCDGEGVGEEHPYHPKIVD